MAKSFNEMTAKDDNTVMIVDALNLLDTNTLKSDTLRKIIYEQ